MNESESVIEEIAEGKRGSVKAWCELPPVSRVS